MQNATPSASIDSAHEPLSPVADIRSAEIRDADTLEQELSDWQIESIQLKPGNFQLVTDRIVFPDMVVERSRHNLAKRDIYRLPPGTTSLSLFKRGAPPGHWCGFDVPEDSILVNQSDREHFAVLPDDYEHITVVIADKLLASLHLLSPGLSDNARASEDSIIPLCGAPSVQFRNWLFRLFEAESHRQYLANPEASNEFRDRLLSGMTRMVDAGLTLRGDQAKRSPRATRFRIVRRACGFVTEHIEANLSASLIASELCVSVRSLQRAFIDVLGITPSQYVQVAKLRSVRQMLRDTDRSKNTVSRIAIQHGFTELGRFSIRYKQMYGESPSQTLRRGTRSIAARSGSRKRNESEASCWLT